MTGGQDVLAEQLNGGFDEMEYLEFVDGAPTEDGRYIVEDKTGAQYVRDVKGGSWSFTDGEHCRPNRKCVRHCKLPPEKPAPLAVGLYRVRRKNWTNEITDDYATVYLDGDIGIRGSDGTIGINFTLDEGWTITEALAKAEAK